MLNSHQIFLGPNHVERTPANARFLHTASVGLLWGLVGLGWVGLGCDSTSWVGVGLGWSPTTYRHGNTLLLLGCVGFGWSWVGLGWSPTTYRHGNILLPLGCVGFLFQFLFVFHFLCFVFFLFFSLSVYRGSWRVYVVAWHCTTAVYLIQRIAACLCRGWVTTEHPSVVLTADDVFLRENARKRYTA